MATLATAARDKSKKSNLSAAIVRALLEPRVCRPTTISPRGLPNMTSAVGGGRWVPKKQTKGTKLREFCTGGVQKSKRHIWKPPNGTALSNGFFRGVK